MEVLYYVIYHPQRKIKHRLEVHHLVNGKYVLQPGFPVWFPEINLGIGNERGTYQGVTRDWLYWYDEQGQRVLTPEKRIQEAQQSVQAAQQRVQQPEERCARLVSIQTLR